MNALGLSSSVHVTHIACYWKFIAFALRVKSSVSTGFAEQIMPILHISCYNGSLFTWTVVSLITKFKPLIQYFQCLAAPCRIPRTCSFSWFYTVWSECKVLVSWTPYLTGNTLRLHNNAQPVNAVQGNNSRLLRESYRTHKYILWAKCGMFKLWKFNNYILSQEYFFSAMTTENEALNFNFSDANCLITWVHITYPCTVTRSVDLIPVENSYNSKRTLTLKIYTHYLQILK
jgi:hypothetical protein